MLSRYYIVSGTVRVEGGKTNSMKQEEEATTRRTEHVTVVQEVAITKDRRRGDVISTNYMRRLRGLRPIRTPYGSLVAPEQLGKLKELLTDVNRQIDRFNKTSTNCRLTNGVLWEHPSSKRALAIEGWLARQVKEDRTRWRPIAEELLAS